MERTIVIVIGLLIIGGCSNNSNDAEAITEGDDSGLMAGNETKEQIVNQLQKPSTSDRSELA